MALYALEEYLKQNSEDQSKFPSSQNYFDKYMDVKKWLCKNVFPYTDRVVAIKDNAFMTDHGEEHYHAVIDKCAELLQIGFHEEEKITPYEAFLLLMASLMHDAGMINGRKEHGFSARLVAANMDVKLSDNRFETMTICSIAEAHQGKAIDGTDDTLSHIERKNTLGAQVYRPSLLAAILKFSDEICETRERAASFLSSIGSVPDESVIFHEYALTIDSSAFSRDSKHVELIYTLMDKELSKRFTGNGSRWYMYDWICKKIHKMNSEREYCMKYMAEAVHVFGIKAEIIILDELFVPKEKINIIKDDSGYPQNVQADFECGAYNGQNLREEFCS